MPPRQRRVIEEFAWHREADEFCAYYALDRDIVEAAARYPQSERRDPHSEEVGHLVMNYRRGDMIVTVGFKNPELPLIMHVRLITGDERTAHGSRSAGGPGTEQATLSNKALKRKAVELGYKISPGTKHDKIVDPNNGDHVIVVLAATNRKEAKGDRGGKNAYTTLMAYHRIREHIATVRGEKEEQE